MLDQWTSIPPILSLTGPQCFESESHRFVMDSISMFDSTQLIYICFFSFRFSNRRYIVVIYPGTARLSKILVWTCLHCQIHSSPSTGSHPHAPSLSITRPETSLLSKVLAMLSPSFQVMPRRPVRVVPIVIGVILGIAPSIAMLSPSYQVLPAPLSWSSWVAPTLSPS
jgi:hypothetical protein